MFNPRLQEKLANDSFNPADLLASALNQRAPWESIVEFAVSDKYCNFPLFPRQVTLLRLMFLETEQMTPYDIDVIEDWRKGFIQHRDVYGVQPDIWQRIEYLKQRGYRRFPHIQMVLGRRASKGVLGAILGTEQIAFLHSLDNPQAVYGIAEGKDVYCHDEQTEVLTGSGWKMFAELDGNERLATVSLENGQVELQRPTNLVSYRHSGLMQHLVSGKQLDALVTPDHDMLVREFVSDYGKGKGAGSWSSAAYTYKCSVADCRCGDVFVGPRGGKRIWLHCAQCGILFSEGTNQEVKRCPEHRADSRLMWEPGRYKKKAADLTVGDRVCISGWRHPVSDTSTEEDRDRAWLIGFWLAEGGKHHKNRRTQAMFFQTRRHPEQCIHLEQVLDRLGMTWRRRDKEREFIYVVDDPFFASWLIDNCVIAKDHHCVPSEFFGAPPAVREALCMGHVAGDGCIVQEHPHHFFTSKRLADDIQALYSLNGVASYCVVLRQAGDQVVTRGHEHTAVRGLWCLNITGRTVKQITSSDQIRDVFYDGMVYCATVPNGTLITRRHGKVLVSGNCSVGATSQTQAQRHQFGDLRSMVERCKYFRPKNQLPWIAESKDHQLRIRTPADLRLIAEMKAAKIPVDHPIATLWAVALSANSVAGRGSTSYCLMFDEFAHHVQTGSVKSDDEIYSSWGPSLDQFDKEGLIYIPSSPWTRTGKFHQLYQEGRVLMSNYRDNEGIGEEARITLGNLDNIGATEWEAEPTFLIFQGSSWNLYSEWVDTPKILGLGYKFDKSPESDLTDEVQIRRKRRDPDKFRVEREGQWGEVLGAYLDPDKVDAMFADLDWRDPLTPQSHGIFAHKYRIHCDPGRTGANFALAIAHLEDAPCDKCGWQNTSHQAESHICKLGGHIWPHVIFDLLHVWRPMDYPRDPETDKQTIDYIKVHSDIEEIIGRFISTQKISFDAWNSASFLSSLKQKFSPGIRVVEEPFNEKANQARFEKFKSALNLGWVSSYRDSFYRDNVSCLLELELKFLSVKPNGKVDRQDTGPVCTKDLGDCVQVVAVDLLHDALDRYSAEVMTAGSFGSTWVAGLKSGREQERQAEGLALRNGNKAYEVLNTQKRDRARARLQGRGRVGYQPDRLSSIHVRPPKMPK